jgi:hypothetical protein
MPTYIAVMAPALPNIVMMSQPLRAYFRYTYPGLSTNRTRNPHIRQSSPSPRASRSSVGFMSSTGYTTTCPSSCQLIENALSDYANQTGIDLTGKALAERLELLDSPDAILDLLEEQAKAFKEYREGNRKLIGWLTPVVRTLHVFSGVLGEVTNFVSNLLPSV